MSLPTVIYRTSGAWGSGNGSDLTPAQVDGNFWNLVSRVVALEGSSPTPYQIDDVTVSGATFSVHRSDGTVFGPFVLPVATWNFRGPWAISTAYVKNDTFTNGNTLYQVLIGHTSSATTFDPAAVDGSSNPLYGVLFSLPSAQIAAKGEWAPSTVYAVGDLFTYTTDVEVDFYMVTYPHTSASSFNPGATTSGHADYALLMVVPIPTAAWGKVVPKTAAFGPPLATEPGAYYRYNSASDHDFTLAADSTISFTIGTEFHFVQVSTGALTIVPAGGVTLNKKASTTGKTNGALSVCTIKKVANNTWDLFGDYI